MDELTPAQQEVVDDFDLIITQFVFYIGEPLRSPRSEIYLGEYQRLNATAQAKYNGEYQRR